MNISDLSDICVPVVEGRTLELHFGTVEEAAVCLAPLRIDAYARAAGVDVVRALVDGKDVFPAWRPKMTGTASSSYLAIARLVVEDQGSSALVDNDRDVLMLASAGITASGTTQPPSWWLVEGSDLTPLWDPSTLHDLKRRLKIEGTIQNVEYNARTWISNGSGLIVSEPRPLIARRIELLEVDGRVCRYTCDVHPRD